MTNEYFGQCPHCGKNDGYYNAGESHWFFCEVHKTKWLFGANLFSSWQNQTEDEQLQIILSKGFEKYQEVEPVYPPAQSF
jgi:hypothetical protein